VYTWLKRLPKSGRLGALLASCVGLAFTLTSVEAVNADSKEEATTSPGLEEVVVTAQRRQERLQEVPISAQVISGQALVQQNLNNLEDVSTIVPSVHIGENGRSSDLYIRGVGSGENQAFDQSVGVFVDDIYHGRSRLSAATFLDLDRIEVLKGPQSTFFGNNAIAGAFNMTTRKPTDEFEASVRGLYGQFGQYAAEGAVGIPISNAFSLRIAALADGTNGWLDEENLGEHVPHERNSAARATLTFKPIEQLDATLKIEGSRNRNTGGLGIQIGACPPPAPFLFAPASFCAAALGQGTPIGIDTNRIAQSADQGFSLDTDEYVLTTHYKNWNHTFTSVTGYYSYRYSLNLDGDSTPASLLNIQAPERYRQFSQEFRVESSTDQALQYLLGAYYQHDDLRFNQDFGYFFLTPAVEGIPPFAPLVPFLPLAQNTEFSQPEDVYSLFGSLSWHLGDQLTLTQGLRGSAVSKRYDWDLFYGTSTQDFGGIVPLPPSVAPLAPLLGLGNPGTLSGSRTDHAWMPTTKVQYQFDPAVMGYLSYTRGFKAGGFNGADTTGQASNIPYGPEHVNAYETGLKSTWFQRSLLVNLDVFRSDYSDLQVSTNLASAGGTFVSLVKNAASSRSQGVELETQWLATSQLRFSSNATYLHSYYVQYGGVSPTQLQALAGVASQNLSGQPTEFAPEWSGSVSGTYTVPISGELALVTEATGLFSSAYFLSGTDDPSVRQSGYGRLDARLGVESTDGRWTAELIGKNLTDRTILTFAAPYTLSPGSLYAAKQSTRNVAAQFRYQWR
jgi:iron complex outermembrane receptor protein